MRPRQSTVHTDRGYSTTIKADGDVQWQPPPKLEHGHARIHYHHRPELLLTPPKDEPQPERERVPEPDPQWNPECDDDLDQPTPTQRGTPLEHGAVRLRTDRSQTPIRIDTARREPCPRKLDCARSLTSSASPALACCVSHQRSIWLLGSSASISKSTRPDRTETPSNVLPVPRTRRVCRRPPGRCAWRTRHRPEP